MKDYKIITKVIYKSNNNDNYINNNNNNNNYAIYTLLCEATTLKKSLKMNIKELKKILNDNTSIKKIKIINIYHCKYEEVNTNEYKKYTDKEFKNFLQDTKKNIVYNDIQKDFNFYKKVLSCIDILLIIFIILIILYCLYYFIYINI